MTDLLRTYDPAADPFGPDGYPAAWHNCPGCDGHGWRETWRNTEEPRDVREPCPDCEAAGSVKDLARRLAGHRCVRCGHPFRVGESGEWGDPPPRGEGPVPMPDPLFWKGTDEVLKAGKPRGTLWSDCDGRCSHQGPCRLRLPDGGGPAIKFNDDTTAGQCVQRLAIGPSEGRDPLVARERHAIQAAWRILTVHHLNEVKADCRWWNIPPLCQRCHLNIQRRVDMDRPFPWDHTPWFRPYVAGFYASKYGGEELGRAEVEARLDELLELGRREESVERMPL